MAQMLGFKVTMCNGDIYRWVMPHLPNGIYLGPFGAPATGYLDFETQLNNFPGQFVQFVTLDAVDVASMPTKISDLSDFISTPILNKTLVLSYELELPVNLDME